MTNLINDSGSIRSFKDNIWEKREGVSNMQWLFKLSRSLTTEEKVANFEGKLSEKSMKVEVQEILNIQLPTV